MTFHIVFIVLILFVPQTFSTFKMMVTNGEPDKYTAFTNPLPLTATWEQCLEYCYNLGSCIVAYQENCTIFEIGQISTATKVTGEVIAFKVLDNSTDTCPADATGSAKGYYLANNTYQPYNVSYSSPTWTFQTCSKVSCPTNFTMFVRDKGPWCMQVIEHFACCNRTVGTIMCSYFLSGSQLSGVDNQVEYDWIVAASIPIFQNVSGGLVGKTQYSYTGVWVDGNRTSACTGSTASPCNTTSGFQFSDPTLSNPPTGYIWLSGNPDNSPSPANEIVLRMNSLTEYGMDDTPDQPTTSGTLAACWKGYVCGIKPS